jgi:hypothetical protein
MIPSQKLAPVGLVVIFLGLHATAQAADVSYARDIRPILAAKCFACHGPAEDSREADLRLDTLAGATADLGGHQAIVPGKSAASELVGRIDSNDPDERMPPLKSNKRLTAAEKALLKKWIDEGAKYEPHWAFVRPKRPALPTVSDKNWPKNPIDHFILARLDAEGLKPSPQADAYTLIRRLYLDLIGLPPTIEEADAWHKKLTADAKDNSVNEAAYRELVEHLLASPHYGERWARKWLDLARYADTNGYEKDRPRSVWPYRDWVIRALNADMPFDDFTIKQLAGDMLPSPSQDDLIATGFHRNTMLNEEGGIDPLEFRFYAMTDRVATTGTTWLGLTLGCTQCHTHKYDPITHTEYYQFLALLNNADEPELPLTSPELEETRRKQAAEAEKLLEELPKQWPEAKTPEEGLEPSFARWLEESRKKTVAWTDLVPREVSSNLPHLTVEPDHSVFVSGDITKDDAYTLKIRNVPAGTTALRLEALPDERLPAHGPGLGYYEGPRGDFFLGEFQAFADGKQLKFGRASESYAKNNFGSAPVTAALATDGNPETGWSCAGRMGEAHQAVFVFAEPVTLPAGGELTVTLRFGRHYACSLGRFRISATTAKEGAEARGMPRDVEALLSIPDDQVTDPQRQSLRQQFLLTAPQLAKQAERIKTLRKGPAGTPALVMRERPAENPRPTKRHHRGEFLQAKEAVTPAVPAFLPPLPADQPHDRLALARWLVSPENPLTPRVVANRQWEALFGRGIVATSGDFGFQGEFPSHPELLDWLAVEFMEPSRDLYAEPWSLKSLHRLIVRSATYRQSARTTPELLAKDPHNRLLARAPRLRVEAEIVRDLALKASGMMSEKMYGPPVRPPQPAGVLEVAYGGGNWDVSGGEDRVRRGIYTFIKRSTPYAMFNTFDGPSGENCIARREVSNTPLQALTMLNDSVLMETSQALAQSASLFAAGDDDEAKITFVFRSCLTRPPNDAELKKLSAFAAEVRERITKSELDPKALSGVKDGNVNERAVFTAVSRAILNLDETITRN